MAHADSDRSDPASAVKSHHVSLQFPADELVSSFIAALMSCLAAMDLTRPELWDSYERIADRAAKHAETFDVAARACGESVSAQHVAICAMGAFKFFDKGGARSLIGWHDLFPLLGLDSNQSETRIIRHVLEAGEALSQIHRKAGHTADELVGDAYSAFFALATLFNDMENYSLCTTCIDACCNMIGRPDDSRYLLAAEFGLRAAEKMNPNDKELNRGELLSSCRARYAISIIRAASRGDRAQSAAYDAIYCALRSLPDNQDVRGLFLSSLLPHIQSAPYSSLLPAVILAMPKQFRKKLNGLSSDPQVFDFLLSLPDPSAVLPCICKLDRETWMKCISYLVFLKYPEDGRLSLQQRGGVQAAEADWITWSFRHRTFRHSIPDGSSLLREADLQQLLMVLNHEVTHVVSMQSDIGRAIIALRSALVAFELSLWTHTVTKETAEHYADQVRRGPAPIEGDNLLALAQAEQALEISRKMQILQECWAPWFEGIAVFIEHGADPTDDAEFHAHGVSVLINLVDIAVNDGKISEEEVRVRIKSEYDSREQLYSDAIGQLGALRLYTYLTDYRSHYLGGYLAVRSIVASWRKTLGRPISGSAAGRILLHMTQYGTMDAIPDLGLPLKEFSNEVKGRLKAWIKAAAAASAEDLDKILGMSGEDKPSNAMWRKGRLISVLPGADSGATRASVLGLVDQALTSLVGSNSNANRVIDPSSECVHVMRAVGNGLTKARPPKLLTEGAMSRFAQQWHVMPFGEVEAPFWIHRDSQSLYCLIRTTENHYKRGGTSHNALILTLSPEDFKELEAEVIARQYPWMNVARVVDMIPLDEAQPDRALGRNYLVLRYGKWTHIQARGLLFGSSYVSESLKNDIAARFEENGLISLDAEVFASGQAGASRTRDWLATVGEWRWKGEALDISAWTTYVASLAAAVLDPALRDERDEAARLMLDLALGGGEVTAHVASEGLIAIADGKASSIERLVRLLHESARRPVPTETANAQEFSLLLEATKSGWDVRAAHV